MENHVLQSMGENVLCPQPLIRAGRNVNHSRVQRLKKREPHPVSTRTLGLLCLGTGEIPSTNHRSRNPSERDQSILDLRSPCVSRKRKLSC